MSQTAEENDKMPSLQFIKLLITTQKACISTIDTSILQIYIHYQVTGELNSGVLHEQ